jgi:hypothetical protein
VGTIRCASCRFDSVSSDDKMQSGYYAVYVVRSIEIILMNISRASTRHGNEGRVRTCEDVGDWGLVTCMAPCDLKSGVCKPIKYVPLCSQFRSYTIRHAWTCEARLASDSVRVLALRAFVCPRGTSQHSGISLAPDIGDKAAGSPWTGRGREEGSRDVEAGKGHVRMYVRTVD